MCLICAPLLQVHRPRGNEQSAGPQVVLPWWLNSPGKTFCLAGLLKILVIMSRAVPWAGELFFPCLLHANHVSAGVFCRLNRGSLVQCMPAAHLVQPSRDEDVAG